MDKSQIVLSALAEPLNGVEILEDLACCLIEGLRGNCDLKSGSATQIEGAAFRFRATAKVKRELIG
jgi:hypothetical protein